MDVFLGLASSHMRLFLGGAWGLLKDCFLRERSLSPLTCWLILVDCVILVNSTDCKMSIHNWYTQKQISPIFNSRYFAILSYAFMVQNYKNISTQNYQIRPAPLHETLDSSPCCPLFYPCKSRFRAPFPCAAAC